MQQHTASQEAMQQHRARHEVIQCTTPKRHGVPHATGSHTAKHTERLACRRKAQQQSEAAPAVQQRALQNTRNEGKNDASQCNAKSHTKGLRRRPQRHIKPQSSNKASRHQRYEGWHNATLRHGRHTQTDTVRQISERKVANTPQYNVK